MRRRGSRRKLQSRYRDRLSESYSREIDVLNRRHGQNHSLRLACKIHARHRAEIEFLYIFIHSFFAERHCYIHEYRVATVIQRALQIEIRMFAVVVHTPAFYPLPVYKPES